MATDTHQDDDTLHSKLDVQLWKRILAFARPYRRHLIGLALLAILVGVCDVLLPYLTGRIVNEVAERGRDARIGPLMWSYGISIASFALCVCGFILLAGRITTGVSYDIRQAAFTKLQALPPSFYDRKPVGWLMARLTSDCSNLSRVMGWALLDIAWGTWVIAIVCVAMFVLNWRLALIVLLIVPPLAVVSRYFQLKLLLTSRLLRKANSQTTAAFNEALQGVRTTKSLSREKQNLAEFQHLTENMQRHAVSNALYSSLFLPLVVSICSIGVGLAMWRGGLGVRYGLDIGILVTFLQYAAFIAMPIQELATTLTMVQAAQASAERIASLLSTDVKIQDSPQVLSRIAAHLGNGNGNGNGLAEDGMPARIGTIEFRDVDFTYDGGQTVLRGFNLRVERGESIALVGPTGGGKTTIVALACRFYEPTAGQILIDGVDYRERSLHWLQSQIGLVQQQPHLFSGSVRENIRYGKLDAGDAQVEEAARLAGAHEFIVHLKDGYAANVGEGGNALSTGQKQLVSLARAILADPQLFVMDEATSSVDTATERAIQAAVERVLEGRISFVIAHRLSTIRRCDRILFIDAGKIVESGSHHELLAQRGRYYELYTGQFTHESQERMLAAETVV